MQVRLLDGNGEFVAIGDIPESVAKPYAPDVIVWEGRHFVGPSGQEPGTEDVKYHEGTVYAVPATEKWIAKR